MEEVERVLFEIVQMKARYATEIRGRRKEWPRSIKERVLMLLAAGIKLRHISRRTLIPYETMVLWRRERQRTALVELVRSVPPEFAEVTVTEEVATVVENQVTVAATVPSKVLTVTESEDSSITVTTPDGYTIRLKSAEEAVVFVRGLRSQGGQGVS